MSKLALSREKDVIGLGGLLHWRIAACRSIERHFSWLFEMGW